MTMASFYLSLLTITLFCVNAEATLCEDGWVAYKDELCLKAFSSLLTFDETKTFCQSQGNGISQASMVMVKEADMQNLLSKYTDNIFDNLWLGSRFNNKTNQFTWEDGEPLTYTNWQEGYPRNHSDDEACIELRPVNAKPSVNVEAKWTDTNCQKRNLVICQKAVSWTLQDAIEEIIRIRKYFQEELDEATKERNELREELQSVSTLVVPVGSVYVEYYDQPNPQSLWPTLRWDDITNTYAGLFFRAAGGGSGSWGATQADCAPRVSKLQYMGREVDTFPNPIDVASSGWSEYVHEGEHKFDPGARLVYEGLSLYTESCEVRPKNQAVRIWKRTA